MTKHENEQDELLKNRLNTIFEYFEYQIVKINDLHKKYPEYEISEFALVLPDKVINLSGQVLKDYFNSINTQYLPSRRPASCTEKASFRTEP